MHADYQHNLMPDTARVLLGQTEGDIGYEYNGGYEEDYDEEEIGW
jgi:hypothetical protein